MKLSNYLAGRWQEGAGAGTALTDPVTGDILATVSSQGLDLAAALAHARTVGGAALRAQTYGERAALLGRIAELLNSRRDEYFRISQQNSGATEGDAAFDVDGAIYTLKTFARAGKVLGGARHLIDGAGIALAKTDAFQGQHFMLPLSGVAIFINAFNFPAWGLWEKAAPALLAGMPVLVKPATPTAWLAQRMVADVVAAGILPEGALSIVCGGARDLLDHVEECDVVSFTGSADTAARVRTHPAVVRHSVRVNIEADSVNSAILGPDALPGSAVFDLLVREVVREMTVKSGQKCTAIRRVLAPQAVAEALADAIAGQLAGYPVGNPRHPAVRVGPLVSAAQREAALAGLAKLQRECRVVFGGQDPADFAPLDAPLSAAFLQPTLLLCERGLAAAHVHDTEVFGPVATVVPYADTAGAIAIARRGRGSLVASVFSDDPAFAREVTLGIADLHGRVLVVDSEVGNQHTGHGNVVPSCLHGGGGRAGGGEELGGLRSLAFYHRRFVVQGPQKLLQALRAEGADAALLNACPPLETDMNENEFATLVAQVTRRIAGLPVDAALAELLNREFPADGEVFQAIKDACTAGVAAGWMCRHEAGGIKYGRVAKPCPELHGFSIDVVEMADVVGPQHRHPLGEIDLIMPLAGEALFDGHAAGWLVYGPDSAHKPTVSGGRAYVLYLLPQGAIEFTRG